MAHPDTTEAVRVLNEIVSEIDESCEAYGVEKIKTVGMCTLATRAVASVPAAPGRSRCRAPRPMHRA